MTHAPLTTQLNHIASPWDDAPIWAKPFDYGSGGRDLDPNSQQIANTPYTYTVATMAT